MRPATVAVLLLVAGCGSGAPPVPTDDAVAMAAAERKAVADTDAARRDAAIPGRAAEQN